MNAMVDTRLIGTAAPGLQGGRGPLLLALENRAWPADLYDGAVGWPWAVFQGNGGAGALQQGLGYEKTQTQAGRLAVLCLPARPGGASGDVGIAKGVHDVGGYAVPIVGDLDDHVARRPAGRDLDAHASKIDRVLHQVAETVEHTRPALAYRLVQGLALGVGLGRCSHDQLGAEAAIGTGRLLDQLCDAHARVERVGLGGAARQFSEDFAAADGLRLQER